jgi:hypothetical protein
MERIRIKTLMTEQRECPANGFLNCAECKYMVGIKTDNYPMPPYNDVYVDCAYHDVVKKTGIENDEL